MKSAFSNVHTNNAGTFVWKSHECDGNANRIARQSPYFETQSSRKYNTTWG
jgi:hypothetical protein